MSDSLPQPGLYRHYKGGLYQVCFTVRDSTNGPDEGRLFVLYFSLTKQTFHVREVGQFMEDVDAMGGAVRVPRFAKVSHE